MDFREMLRMTEPVNSREGKLTLLALVMMMYVIALFISIAIHEILGHGLFATLLGADFYAVYLSPGSGFASLWLPPTISNAEIGLIYSAGILVQQVVGIAVLFLVMPRIKGFMMGIFTLMFCVTMLVHSSLYLFMGYFYSGGDTMYAVNFLGIPPDAFLVTGIILAGTFTLLISMASLRFMGKFMDLDDEGERKKMPALFWLPPLLLNGALRFMGRFMGLDEEAERRKMLALFWSPPLLLNGAISFIYSLFLPRTEIAYPLLNSAMMLMFIGLAIFLVPMFSETVRERDYGIPMKSVFAVVLCFILLVTGWAGVFGASRESAHGLLLHDPPIETEIYYSDYTLGNAYIMIYANGTIRADIILRNRMESPSPLESKIYHTFDMRPDWERHIARSRNMLVTMFDLPREVGENLTFSTEYGTVRATDDSDDLGRKCTTFLNMDDAGTRQHFITPGEQTPQPGMGIILSDMTLSFTDPWVNQGGYLDEVTIAWEPALEAVEILAWNENNESISFDIGESDEFMVAWSNGDALEAPSNFSVKFKYV